MIRFDGKGCDMLSWKKGCMKTGKEKISMGLRYADIIGRMTLEEKARMLSGKNTWETVDF